MALKETAQIRINAGRNELMLSALRVQVDPTVRRKGARNYKAIRELQRETASASDRCSVLAVLFSMGYLRKGSHKRYRRAKALVPICGPVNFWLVGELKRTEDGGLGSPWKNRRDARDRRA